MRSRLTILFTAALLLAACSDGPRDIAMGAEECAHCRMLISEEAFAAQLRTEHGRSLAFDSIECLADYVQQSDEEARGMWVTDFTQPGTWLEAREATYLQSPQLRSPMGLNLTAYSDRAAAESQAAEYGGDVLDWAGVLEILAPIRVTGGAENAH